jgi:hypothetical protein
MTDAGVLTLIRALGNGGNTRGRGMGHEAEGERQKLRRDGHLDDDDRVTDAGRAIVRRAREMGY